MNEIKDLVAVGIDDNCILAGYRGSVAHGTYIEPEEKDGTDDVDVMGVVVPGIDHYFGLSEYGSRGTMERWVGNYDVVLYEARKFIRLAQNCNPNVLDLLWLPDDLYLKKTDAGCHLICYRNVFLGRNAVYDSFSGYAAGQLKRMEHGSGGGFMGAKRKQRFAELGYDAKNANHLVRLL